MTLYQIIIIVGLSVMLSGYLVGVFTFLGAALNPELRYVVDVNSLGEYKIELWILVLSLPMVIYTWFYLIVKNAE